MFVPQIFFLKEIDKVIVGPGVFFTNNIYSKSLFIEEWSELAGLTLNKGKNWKYLKISDYVFGNYLEYI